MLERSEENWGWWKVNMNLIILLTCAKFSKNKQKYFKRSYGGQNHNYNIDTSNLHEIQYFPLVTSTFLSKDYSEYPPKAHVLNHKTPTWHYREEVEPLRGGASWRSSCPGKCPRSGC